MSANINLVAKKGPADSKAEKIKKIKGISFAVLIATAFFALLIFGLDYRFSASYVRKQQADLLSELSRFNDTSAKIFIVNSKLSDISTILTARKKYNELTEKIAAANTGGAEIEDYMIDESGISITVSSNSLSSIDGFLNGLLELINEEVITGVYLNKLRFQGDKYVVELTML